MTFEWNQEDPLTRVKSETQRANHALGDYVAMGPGRSLSKLHQKYTGDTLGEEIPPTRWLGILKKWSSRYDWQARLARWAELERKRDETIWEDRRRQEREAEWEDAQSLRERAERMEQFPLAKVERVEDTYEDGRPKSVTIVHPAKWSQADVARHRDLAAKLARLAAELETERKAMDVTTKGEKLETIKVREFLGAETGTEEEGAGREEGAGVGNG